MLRSGVFWAGVAAGGLVAWFWARRSEQFVAATPYYPKPIRRRGRRGAGWGGQTDAYSR
ncbi:MAG TPA: hypothetical protein VOB72_04075 [Candidatus Dormibacteraeota bacterium]|nr:hypothetical protein [Candidatus Dormibacteraeota bacterium]